METVLTVKRSGTEMVPIILNLTNWLSLTDIDTFISSLFTNDTSPIKDVPIVEASLRLAGG